MSARGNLSHSVGMWSIVALVTVLMVVPVSAALGSASVPPPAARAASGASAAGGAGSSYVPPGTGLPSGSLPTTPPTNVSPISLRAPDRIASEFSHPSSPHVPSSATTTKSFTSLSTQSPATASPNVTLPWYATPTATTGAGSVPHGELVAPPNLGLVSDDRSSVASEITPGYQAPPAPMGIADYGVGASGSYSYNTSRFLGTVVLNAPPNVTAPSSEALIDPTGASYGLVGSPYEFSLQLNTVETNVTIPGTSDATLWVQNVLDVNATAIHFVDDVWNVSADSSDQFASNAVASGCGLENLSTLLTFYGGIYQCVGGSVAINPSNYPLTIQLYNNATVNGLDDGVQFGYRIVGQGGLLATGVSDNVVFANPTDAAPAYPIGFTVSGTTRTPVQPGDLPQLLQDAELTFGGPIGGLNAVFNSLNASVSLQFQNGSGPWTAIPSAYNFGSDTGETSIGIAGTWSSAGVEELHQGPSFLYGLWGAPANVSVASGAIQFRGTADPTYGFVFVSNVYPGANETNLSYVPTNASGGFDTYLPPAIPIGGGAYNTAFFAPGYTSVIGTNFTTSESDYVFPVGTSTSTIDAPLYMNGWPQAESLAEHLVGWTSTEEYMFFENLVVNLPLAFTHLNDYDYPSFVIVQAENLTYNGGDYYFLDVTNVTEGSNVPGGELYTLDYALPPGSGGWMSPAPGTVGPWQNYTQEIDLFGDVRAGVVDESFLGSFYYGTPGSEGGALFLFGDLDASADLISAAWGSEGVANELSSDTRVLNLNASSGANALDDIGSFDTHALNVSAAGAFVNLTTDVQYSSVAVYALDSWYGQFYYVNATDGAFGYDAGYASPFGPAWSLVGSIDEYVAWAYATQGAVGGDIAYSVLDSFFAVSANTSATAFVASQSWSTSLNYVNATDANGIGLFGDNWTGVGNYSISGAFQGTAVVFSNSTEFNHTTLLDDQWAEVFGSNNTTFVGLGVFDTEGFGTEGLVVDNDTNSSFRNVTVGDTYGFAEGLVVEASTNVSFRQLDVPTVELFSGGVVVEQSNGVSLNGVSVANVSGLSAGLVLEETDGATVNNTSIVNVTVLAAGLILEGTNHTVVDGTTLSDVRNVSAGVLLEGANATDLAATVGSDLGNASSAIEVTSSYETELNNTSLFDLTPNATGLAVFASPGTVVSNTSVADVQDGSVGIAIQGSNGTAFSATTLRSISGGSAGLELNDSPNASFVRTMVATVSGGESVGVVLNGSNDASFDFTSIVGVGPLAVGLLANGSASLQLRNTTVHALTYDSVGVSLNASPLATLTNTTVYGVSFGSVGVSLNASPGATVSNDSYGDLYYSVGASLNDSPGGTFANTTIYDVSYSSTGLVLNASGDATLTGTSVSNVFYGGTGVDVNASLGVAFTDTSDSDVYGDAAGVYVDDATAVSFVGSTIEWVSDDGYGVEVFGSTGVSFAGSTVQGISGYADGVIVFTSNATTFVQTTVRWVHYGSYGLAVGFSNGTTLEGTSVTQISYDGTGVGFGLDNATVINQTQLSEIRYGALGLFVGFDCNGTSLNGTTVVDSHEGLLINDSTNVSLNATAVFASGLGAEINGSSDVQVNQTFVGEAGTGLEVFNSSDATFNGTYVQYAGLGIDLQNTSGASVNGTWVQDADLGLMASLSPELTISNLTANATAGEGAYLTDTNDLTLRGIVANDTLGVFVGGSVGVTARNVTATGPFADPGLGISDSSDLNVRWVNASDSFGVQIQDSSDASLADISVTGSLVGAYLQGVTTAQVTQVSATGESVGVAILGSSDVSVAGVGATNASVGAAVLDAQQVTVANASASDRSNAVDVLASELVSVRNVSASNATLQGLWPGSGIPGLPIAAVATGYDTAVSIAYVNASRYPTAVYDNDSDGLSVSFVNATDGQYALVLNGTTNSLFSGIDAYQDLQGIVLQDPSFPGASTNNTITGGSFVDDTSYGVLIASGSNNTVWNNAFVGDNGATSTYSPAHIQAWSVAGNAFDVCTSRSCSNGTGNYWADWHTYGSNGHLAPYLVTGGVYDEFPLGPEETTTVTFAETGLAPGTSWSVNLNGASESSSGTSISFAVPYGAFAFTVGAVAGYTVSPASGSGVVGGASYLVNLSFHPVLYAVTLSAGGLPSGTVWSATVNGSTQSTSGGSLTFELANGSYDYAFGPVTGYTLGSGSSGELTVAGAPLSLAATYTGAPVTVTFSESGLQPSTSWSVVLNGVLESGTGSTLTFTVAAGSYAYQVVTVAGYTVTPSGGTATVAANYLIAVAFSPNTGAVGPSVTVEVTETGLPAGTPWTAIFGGTSASGTAGSPIAFTVTGGASYSYQIPTIPGYAANPSSGSASVGTAPYTLAIAFSTTVVPTVTVELKETGLPSTQAGWSAIFAGVEASAAVGAPIEFTVAANASYAFQVPGVAGYTVSLPSGTATVGSSTYVIAVVFAPVTYAVTFGESGLANGASWTVTVAGTPYSSSASSLTVYLANGSYAYSYGSVGGYTLAGGTGTASVAGSPSGVSASYTSTSPSSSYVGKSTFNTAWAAALALAAVAVVLALVALFRRPKAPAPASPWQEPGSVEGSPSGAGASEPAADGPSP